MFRRFFLTLVLTLSIAVEAKAACRSVSHNRVDYTMCEFDPAKVNIEIYNLNPAGEPFGDFDALSENLLAAGKTLRFAMNAGMFDEQLKPIGLYVEDGKQARKLNRRGGFGNFHLKPNGVFFLVSGKARVLETDAYARLGVKPDFATQSGPMLVIDGQLHPRFSATGTSRKRRNGVGVTKDGMAVFALSEGSVNFHDFATLFRDELGCDNALFLDGSVSSLYAPELNRNDRLVPLGPMVGVTETR